MSEQPKALWLADALENPAILGRPTAEAAAELRRLHFENSGLVEVLERISYAKPDQLDHAIDVSIIERCAALARAALAKAEWRDE